MQNFKLKDRIETYAKVSDYKLLNKLPVVIIINGRSFLKLTSLLEKPYSNKLAECLCSTLVKLMQEIDGAVFGYTFNDEMVIIARNDQTNDTMPWCDNNIQKISSLAASIATLQFHKYSQTISADLNYMSGEPTFYTRIFTVPNITEAINFVVSKQQQAFQSSVYFACFYELLKKYKQQEIKELLNGATLDDKITLLKEECNIDYNEYPIIFRRGVACYRSPQITTYEGKQIIKNKIVLNTEIPIFTQEHSFLQGIFNVKTNE